MENFTTRVPGEVRQAIRLAAVAQRRSVQEIVTEALQQWLASQPR
jgi:predicted HicB family RNase H-like nuclease